MKAKPAQMMAHTTGPDETCYEVFNTLDQGFCTIEVPFDANGVAKDYRSL